MGNRKHPFRTGHFYHIYNRGVEKRPIYLNASYYQEFLKRLAFYQQERQPVRYSQSGFSFEARREPYRFEILAYALMPNHFHLLIHALTDDGVPKSLAQFINSYTKYFNTRHQRVGALFQGVYQSVYVESDEQLLQVFRYILLNPYTAKLEDRLGDYPWTSYKEIKADGSTLTNPKLILELFQNNHQAFFNFLNDYAGYARELEEIKHLLID